ncbi:ARM repeat-containing protein [Polychaeton citri CBS 116435]|uniref:ARM repeat-containing protein n=1 Tax=Polychaeton citri CBS 116435 TaxID=1314669 RepID=A0A9P4Q3Z0_9PEZI|nr:ARM repeat-containing protein [Polychaeton citri CBS 116435]
MSTASPPLDLLEKINAARNLQEKVDSLRVLKNAIVGHDQRKEILVRSGILPLLSSTVFNAVTPTTSKSSHWDRDSEHGIFAGNDEALLQATLVVSSLAQGGPAFVAPLRASKIIPDAMVTLLRVRPLPKLALVVLTALKNYATAWAEGFEASGWRAVEGGEETCSNSGIFDESVLNIFNAILNTTAGKQGMLKPICCIIASAATRPADKNALLNAGILETLTSLFASLTAPHVLGDSNVPSTPLEESSSRCIGSLSKAISTIIEGSNYRIQCFCYAEATRKLLGAHLLAQERASQAYWGPKHGFKNSYEVLLPPIHMPSQKGVNYNSGSSAFPALGLLRNKNANASFPLPLGDSNIKKNHTLEIQVPDVEHINAIASWLLHLARSRTGVDRLHLLKLLAIVNNAHNQDPFGTGVQRPEVQERDREREKRLSLLAVPLAIDIIQRYSNIGSRTSSANTLVPVDQVAAQAATKEDCCAVLALLVERSKLLQSAAVDAGAIKHVCASLKKSFDNVPLAKPMWSSQSTQRFPIPEGVDPRSCNLGPKGLPSEILSATRCRRGALEAIAALARQEDSYRKAVVDAGAVSSIIDALKVSALPSAEQSHVGLPTVKETNTPAVILSACKAAQSMSRSVSLLRTSLIDAGISKPILSLLSHSDGEVQLAATDVCCNIILDFSPMREDLMAEGVVGTLSKHAKSADERLRLSSLWALKHLVLSAPRNVKVDVVEEIGVDWLFGIVAGETNGANGGGGVASGASLTSMNASGGRVDLLNPSGEVGRMEVDDDESGGTSTSQIQQQRAASEDDDDEDEDGEEAQSKHEEDHDSDGELLYDSQSQTHYHSSELRSTLRHSPSKQDNPNGSNGVLSNPKRFLSSLHTLETSSQIRLRSTSISIQEQALDFIRNLFNGDDCLPMVDFLLLKVGHQKFFDMLTFHLSPINHNGSKSVATTTEEGGKRQVYNPTVLVLSTLHILTHLANAGPRIRRMIVAQKALLKAWVNHFVHPAPKVRVLCVWAVNSLTWIESDGSATGGTDATGAMEGVVGNGRREARYIVEELRKVGVEHKVRALLTDADLDVRERCKTAVRQIESV